MADGRRQLVDHRRAECGDGRGIRLVGDIPRGNEFLHQRDDGALGGVRQLGSRTARQGGNLGLGESNIPRDPFVRDALEVALGESVLRNLAAIHSLEELAIAEEWGDGFVRFVTASR